MNLVYRSSCSLISTRFPGTNDEISWRLVSFTVAIMSWNIDLGQVNETMERNVTHHACHDHACAAVDHRNDEHQL